MSWSVSFTGLTIDQLTNLEVADSQLQNGLAREPFDRAVAALCELVEAGVLGDPEDLTFSGSLSGHANENHVSPGGWSPDSISMHVSQVKPQSAEDKAANQEGSPYA
jgi:hypothetical protein